MEKIISGSFWRRKTENNYSTENHPEKIGLCQVICEAVQLPQEEKLVVTQELYGTFAIKARSYADFVASYQEELVRISEIPVEQLPYNKNESEISVKPIDSGCDKTEHLTPEKEELDPDLAAFLDAGNPKEKLELLYHIKNHLNEYLMSSIEISMDLPVGSNSLEERLDYVKRHLQTVSRFESSRLRD